MPGGLWQENCQLSQDPHDNFDWDIGYGRMHNGTGPSADHSPSKYNLKFTMPLN